MATEHCPTCHRAGASAAEIQARCGSFLTCAKRTLPVDPSKEVVISCDNCDVALAVPASLITSGKSPRVGAVCQRSSESCIAVVVTTPSEGVVMVKPRGKSAKS